MNEVWVYTTVSVAIVSLFSFIGILALFLSRAKLKNILLFFVSFAAGALLGDVFFHILPEIVEEVGFNYQVSSFILGGILLFFILEKVIHWRHCHEPTSESHPHHLATLNLIGDGLHNFFDGLIIGGSYLVSLPLGIATTLAVIFHEIPQEIGDFSVLLYAGIRPKRALFYNFLSGLLALVGALLILIFNQQFSQPEIWLLPITGGGFLYIAVADLIPELHREVLPRRSLLQLFCIILGMGVMVWLLFIE